MPDLTQTFFDIPLWLWSIGVVAIIFIAIVIARKMEFEGVNITATPPFFQFRFKRKSAREQTRQVSANPMGFSASGERSVVVAGDNRGQIFTGDIHLPPASPPPEPKPHTPAQQVEIYIQRGIEDKVRARLLQTGVAAIVGIHAPGGVGKTELAKYVSRSLRDQFGEPVWVNLGDKTPEQIIGDFALAVGAQLSPNANYAQRRDELHAYLQRHKFLIILDDAREPNRAALADFLPPSPPCAAMVTSRIHELTHAIAVNARFDLGNMTDPQARELLTAALGAERVNAESDAVQRLIARVKANPLALDIAARRIYAYRERKNPVAFFLEKLEQRLDELHAGDDPRLNWEAVMDLSYNDLTPADQKRFRALAVFSAQGFTVPAAQLVWNDNADAVRQAIARLHNFSLLKMLDTLDERYRLHDLLDEYAMKKLRAHGEENEANDRHAQYLAQLFDEHYTDDPSTAPEIVPELENLRAAVRWARTTQNGKRLAELATKSRNWMVVLNWYTEWSTWLTDALRIGKDYDRQLEANVRKAMGDVQQFRKEMDAALESYAHALELFRAVGSKLGEANVRKAMGDVQQFRKEMDAALESYAHALELFRAVGDRLGEANVLAAQCRLLVQAGELAQAEKNLVQVIAIRREIGDLYSEGADYGNFALVLLNVGEKAKAKSYVLKAKQVFEQIGEPYYLQWVERVIAACD